MTRPTIEAKALREEIAPGVVRGEWWHRLDDGRVQCDLCPRYCKLHEGQRGFCFVREARGGEMVLTSYGRARVSASTRSRRSRSTTSYPGTQRALLRHRRLQPRLPVLPELGHLQGARDRHACADQASPEAIARGRAWSPAARSVAFTYNDPVIFAEYAIDCANAVPRRAASRPWP